MKREVFRSSYRFNGIALTLLLAAGVARAQTNNLSSLLQQGLLDEQASHNLDAAIADYQSLATQFDKDRQIAATAIYRLGECYRMLGRTNDAIAQYERIVREFSDQQTLSTLSRQDLTGLGHSENSSQPSASLNSSIAQEMELVQKLKAMPVSQIVQVAPHLLDDSTLNGFINQYNQFNDGLAALEASLGPKNPQVQEKQNILKLISQQILGCLDGMSQALSLKMAASGSGPTGVAPDEQNQEIQRLKQMIQNSPDLLNASSEGKLPPLREAAGKGQLRVAEFLINSGADVNGGALYDAAAAGQNAMVKLLLDHGASTNAASSALLAAARNGFETVAETLLAAHPNLNLTDSFGHTALGLAVADNHLAMIQLLLAHGADPNADKVDGPLFDAIRMQDTALAKMLLQSGADPNKPGKIELFQSFQFRPHRNNLPITPLAYALGGRSLPIVKLLLKFKADPNAPQPDGGPLIFDSLSDTNILEAILDAGAKTHGDPAPWSRTPLNAAARDNEADAVEILLKHGADPNLANEDGDTPLQSAANGKADEKVFASLLAYKADPNVRNDAGQTPLETVKEMKLPQSVIDLLKQHGALENLPHWDEIRVSRESSDFSAVVFRKGTNDWNHFTLFEAILNFYNPQRQYSMPMEPGGIQLESAFQVMPFPDLKQILILRPSRDLTAQQRIPVNLLNDADQIDCSRNVPLQFGDVMEIPQRDHSLDNNDFGLPQKPEGEIYKCLQGAAELDVAAQGEPAARKSTIPLNPIGDDSTIDSALRQQEARKILLASSDMAHVKVTRRDPQTGKVDQWTFDCSDNRAPTQFRRFRPAFAPQRMPALAPPPESSTDFRLKNGDVIYVPEKTN